MGAAEIYYGGTREIWASGMIPWTSDTKRQLWIKKLLVIQSKLASPDPNNNPMLGDTRRILKLKCVRAANSL